MEERTPFSSSDIARREEWPTTELLAILRCPRCGSRLERPDLNRGQPFVCTNTSCKYSSEGFPAVGGQPILIDFDASILDRESFIGRGGRSPLVRDDEGTGLNTLLRRFALIGRRHRRIEGMCAHFIRMVKARAKRPRVLVVGGGAIGFGAAELYSDKDIDLVGTDVYASVFTRAVADAHNLPFADGTFDGVWITGVLQCLLEPSQAVRELHRVLTPGGAVFVATGHVHPICEGPYEFFRTTPSGLRWLLRDFKEEMAGVDAGAATSLIWTIRYFVRGLTGSNRAGTGAALAFFWLRYFNRLMKRGPNADGSNSIYFLGRKADSPMSHKDIVKYYWDYRGVKARS